MIATDDPWFYNKEKSWHEIDTTDQIGGSRKYERFKRTRKLKK